MFKVVQAVLVALFFILGITFAMENSGWVVLRYYFGLETPPVPVFLLVLFSVFLGVLLTGMSFIVDEWSLKRAIKEKEREIESLERELRIYRESRDVPTEETVNHSQGRQIG